MEAKRLLQQAERILPQTKDKIPSPYGEQSQLILHELLGKIGVVNGDLGAAKDRFQEAFDLAVALNQIQSTHQLGTQLCLCENTLYIDAQRLQQHLKESESSDPLWSAGRHNWPFTTSKRVI